MADLSFLQWPFFDESHREFASALAAWRERADLPHHVSEARLDHTCRTLVKTLGSDGWLRHAAPLGGQSLDVRKLCLAREMLAYSSGLADFAFAMQGLGSGPITLFGDAAQREAYLPDVASGKKIAAFALSEPNAGSDAAELETQARADGDHYVLDGVKTWISNGGIADFYIVFARTGEAPGSRGLSAFIVEADTPGLTIAERISVIAPHPLARLEFDNCRVPKKNLIGQPGGGFKVAMGTLDVFRSTVGAAALGFARKALDASVMYASERRIAGGKLADLQMTQAAIADMALGVDAAALLVYRAAWAKDSGAARVTREAAMAKLYATEAAQVAADKAVQIFGGLGVKSGEIAEMLYREVRALRIYEGASEVQKVIIARQAMAQGAAQ